MLKTQILDPGIRVAATVSDGMSHRAAKDWFGASAASILPPQKNWVIGLATEGGIAWRGHGTQTKTCRSYCVRLN